MLSLGVDIGTTSIKGAVLDPEIGSPRFVISEPFPEPIGGLAAGHVEIDPTAVVAATRRVLGRLLEAAPDARAVFFCGQMGGVILVDPGTLRPITNYLSWRDLRTQEPHRDGGSYLEVIRGRWPESTFTELGRELKPGSVTSLLFWLAERGRLVAGAVPASIGDYVVADLCGVSPRTDRTMAIGLLDLGTRDWHRPALAALGLDQLTWPNPAGPAEPIGRWRPGAAGLTCHSVIGDQPCALHGVGLGDDDLSLNVSTGAQVSRLTREWQPGEYQSRVALGGRFLNTVTHLPAGRSLNVLFGVLTELARAEGVTLADPWGVISRAVETASDDGLVCDTSFYQGGHGGGGRIDRITTDNLTVGNLFLAAFRNMAETYATAAGRLDPRSSWSRVLASGGLVQRFPALRRLIEERFTGPVVVRDQAEETLVGLLRLAGSAAQAV